MAALWVDQLAARGQVIRRNQPGLRHGDKIRVGQIALAVGKRQPAGFAIQMHGVGRVALAIERLGAHAIP